MTILAAFTIAQVLVLWSGPAPACEQLGGTIVRSAPTLAEAAVKAQKPAASRGATHLWVSRAWEGNGWAKVETVAYRCEQSNEGK